MDTQHVRGGEVGLYRSRGRQSDRSNLETLHLPLRDLARLIYPSLDLRCRPELGDRLVNERADGSGGGGETNCHNSPSSLVLELPPLGVSSRRRYDSGPCDTPYKLASRWASSRCCSHHTDGR